VTEVDINFGTIGVISRELRRNHAAPFVSDPQDVISRREHDQIKDYIPLGRDTANRQLTYLCTGSKIVAYEIPTRASFTS